MIPDINVVKEKSKHPSKKNAPKADSHCRFDETVFIVIDYFYNQIEEVLNQQLLAGYPAIGRLDYWAVRSYMENELHNAAENDTYFKILDAVFANLQVNYTIGGYTVYIDKQIGTKSNFNAYYESRYICQIKF